MERVLSAYKGCRDGLYKNTAPVTKSLYWCPQKYYALWHTILKTIDRRIELSRMVGKLILPSMPFTKAQRNTSLRYILPFFCPPLPLLVNHVSCVSHFWFWEHYLITAFFIRYMGTLHTEYIRTMNMHCPHKDRNKYTFLIKNKTYCVQLGYTSFMRFFPY